MQFVVDVYTRSSWSRTPSTTGIVCAGRATESATANI